MTVKPLRADAQRNRDAIVAAARAAFAADAADIRFDDFAELAGVGTGTLYRHFPTRSDLAAAVYLDEADALCALAEHLGATLPAADALESFLHAFVAYLDENRGLARALIAASGSGALAEGGQDLEAAVRGLVDDGAAKGALRDDVDAGSILIMMHGISGTFERENWRTDADSAVTLLCAGARAKG